jgi:hypothetical protein
MQDVHASHTRATFVQIAMRAVMVRKLALIPVGPKLRPTFLDPSFRKQSSLHISLVIIYIKYTWQRLNDPTARG